MAGMRSGLLREIVGDGVRHAAHEQDALGADRARRRHRHHLDRRHDLAHPRLRRVAARLDPRSSGRTRSSCRSSARSASPSGKSFLELAQAAQPDDRGCPGDRARVPVGRRWSTSGSAAGRQRAIAHLLRPRAHQAARRSSARPRTSPRSTSPSSSSGRFFTPAEVEHRRQVVVLGQTPYQSLFPNIDPIGKKVRIGANEFTVIGVLGKRPSPAASTRRRRLRRDPVHARTRSSTARCSTARRDHREQLQPRGVPHGDDRRRAARGRARATQAMREVEADDAHPPRPEARRAERLRPGRRRTRS